MININSVVQNISSKCNEMKQSLKDKKQSLNVLSKRTIENPTFRALLLGAITTASLAYTGQAFKDKTWGEFSGNVLMTALFGMMTKLYVDKNHKHIRNEYALSRNIFYNKFTDGFPWWNEVIDDQLLVGGIPLENWGHPQSLSALGVKNIVSVVEQEEFGPKILSVPARFETNPYWLHVSAADHGPVDASKIKEAVEWINSKMSQNEKVYVHCKSGKGRSVMVVLSFLFLYGSKYDSTVRSIMENPVHTTTEQKVDALCAYMKTKRRVVNPNKEQIQAVVDFLKNS